MDDDLAAAITAAELPPGTAGEWFTLVTTAYRRLVDSGSGTDLPLFRRSLTTLAADHFVDPAVPAAFLARVPDLDVVRRLCALGSELPLRYDELRRAAAAGPPADDEEAPQASPWERLLARYGGEWSAWDGSDDGWARFRDWFYTAAYSFDQQAYAEAYHRLQPLNDASAADRVERLRGLGLPVTATPPEPPAPEPEPRRGPLSRLLPHRRT